MTTELAKLKRNPDLTSIYLVKGTRDKLRDLKKEVGFRSYDALLNYSAIALRDLHRDSIEYATFDDVFVKLETKPVIITGLSGSGKSTAARDLITRLPAEINLLVIDSSGSDYPDLKQLDFGAVFALHWGKRQGERLRYCPDPNRDIAKLLVNQIVGRLFTVMPSGDLKDWVFIVDEASRYRDGPLKDFVIESRKWVRKTIVITTSWKDYEEVGKVFRPRPWGAS
jgi:energy-coupling factor transporter ATP-binding protein EcfA2